MFRTCPCNGIEDGELGEGHVSQNIILAAADCLSSMMMVSISRSLSCISIFIVVLYN